MTALTVLRGKNNLEIVNIELKNIIENMEQVKQNVKTSDQGSMLKHYYGILTDPTFFKPFGVFNLGGTKGHIHYGVMVFELDLSSTLKTI